jgi:hypothetical protein
MLRSPLSSPLRHPLQSPLAARRGGGAPAFDPATLFASGELGGWFDRQDTALMRAGNTFLPVTGAGQAISCAANKRVPPTIVTSLPVMTMSASVSQSGNLLTFASSPAGHQASGPGINGASFYRMSFVVTGSGSVTIFIGSVPKAFPAGTYLLEGWHSFGSSNFIFRANTGGFNGSVEFLQYESYSSSSYIGTAGFQPLYQLSPPRLVFDGIDDTHLITFPSSLGSNCTIGRSLPGVGAQILTNQTIGTSFNVTTTDSGLVIINRALTAGETAGLTSYLEDAAFFP